MGWAKYDEDNRDYIEERWSNIGSTPTVFNYTVGYRTKPDTARTAAVPRSYSLGPHREEKAPSR